ncbi:triose-phosphate isomerase [Candidatus Moduliflexota bacterium]
MRTPLMAGNWKLNLTIEEAVSLAGALREAVDGLDDREVMVAPVFTALSAVARVLEGSSIGLGGQNLYWEEKGAFTGEVSGPLLRDAGCSHVIIGHSERRQYFAETDESVNRRTRAALAAGLVPVVCVGETLEERESGRAQDVVERQVRGGLEGFSADEVSAIVLAYEPVWAIGTGKTATPDEADGIHAFIRGLISSAFGDIVSDRIRILYGGSVKPDNVDDLMTRTHIDGALVGGASLKAESFARIARFEWI